MPEPKPPIFIVGAGRSGSTAFHHAFARHPEVSWVSKILDVMPRAERLNAAVLEGLDKPVLSKLLNRALIEPGHLKPSEAYNYWERIAPGFSEPFRDLLAADLTERTRVGLTDAVARLTVEGRPAPLIKITGWPRTGYLRAAFPEARFIHIVRDGRAVVNSILQVDFWDGWRGTKGWRGLDMTDEQRCRWEASGRSFVTLAAMELSDMLEAMIAAQALIPADRFLELRYEDLCEDPLGSFATVTEFCRLDNPAEFVRTIDEFGFRNTNDKWTRDLTVAQQILLEQELEPHLRRWNYPIAHDPTAA